MAHTRQDSRSNVSRRRLLKLGGVGLAALARPSITYGAAAKPAKRHIPVGLQLYSVRDACAKDIDATLKQVADMGFEAVEFAGYHKYDKDPQGLRKTLDQLGLKVAGTHIRAKAFLPADIKNTIDFHKTIGCHFLIVPGDSRFTDPEKSKEYAKVMTDAAAALKAEGLSCGHHNHTAEFNKDGDKTYWDLFVERTSKDVIMQLDIGHAVKAGADPVALLKHNPNRIKSTHVKGKTLDQPGKKPIIGQDAIDWKTVVAACYDCPGVEWLLVEQEEYPDGLSSIDASRKSLQGFRKFLAAAGH